MKKLIAFTFILLFAFSIEVLGDIKMTHHDFSWWFHVYPAGSNPNKEICVFCHTPHNAMNDPETSAAPLWNHEITPGGYNLYTSATLDTSVETPGGISKLCLSCHDGTVAVDSHSGISGSVYLGPPGSGFGHEGGLIGTDLRDDHPISFDYNSALAASDGGLRDPAATSSGVPAGGSIADDMLFNGKVECSSCHDVHVSRYDSSSACLGCHMPPGASHWSTPPPLTLSLRKSNQGSALCLTCHIK